MLLGQICRAGQGAQQAQAGGAAQHVHPVGSVAFGGTAVQAHAVLPGDERAGESGEFTSWPTLDTCSRLVVAVRRDDADLLTAPGMVASVRGLTPVLHDHRELHLPRSRSRLDHHAVVLQMAVVVVADHFIGRHHIKK